MKSLTSSLAVLLSHKTSSLPCSKSSVFHRHSKSLRVSNVFPPLHHAQQKLLVLQLVFLCVVLYTFVELFSLWERGGEECLHRLFYFSLPGTKKFTKHSMSSTGVNVLCIHVYSQFESPGLNIAFRCIISKRNLQIMKISALYGQDSTSCNVVGQRYLFRVLLLKSVPRK